MSDALKFEPGVEESRRTKHFGSALAILLLIYLITWAYTRAHFMADTSVYAEAILDHERGGGPLDYHLMTSNPFWDFGHLVWRPLGWLCFVITRPVTQWSAQHNERAEVLLTLIGINFVAALACVSLFFLLARRVIGDDWPALVATIGFFSADAFLNYAHTGNAYVVGLACLVAGMYFLLSQEVPAVSLGRALVAALMFVLAVLFWFPYIFVLPAAMAAPLLLYGHERQRLRLAGQTLLACAVLGMAAYASATAAVGIRSVTDLKQWILGAGHGQIQLGGLRAAARLAFALPRSFINMDRDGMWLKRYLVHDPYAQVTARDLFRLSLWKLLLFYASAVIVCAELWRSKRGRMLLLLLASTVLPIFIFAVFIFEAGSIERYLPLYPFVFLAWGYVLAGGEASRASRCSLMLFLIAAIAVNVNSMRKGTLESKRAKTIARIHDLIPLLGPNSLVMAVNGQDNLAEFHQNFPLDAINVNAQWQTYVVIEINAARLSAWRQDLARRVLGTWQRGGTVWLPMRFLRARPNPKWNWVEGDDRRVAWTDLPSFFSQFETGPAVGGEDGFVVLAESPKNKGILDSLSRQKAAK